MTKPELNEAEQRIEEIRGIRRRLFDVGSDYRRLREMGNRIPEGYRVLRGVRPITPLSQRIDEASQGNPVR